MFAPVAMVAVHPDRASADLYLAGHPAPLLLGAPSTLLPTHARGRALGIPVPGSWAPARLDLTGGPWRILLYTDGVLEGHGPRRIDPRRQGPGSWRSSDEALSVGRAVDLVERTLQAVRALHGGDLVDDAALVVLGWGA